MGLAEWKELWALKTPDLSLHFVHCNSDSRHSGFQLCFHRTKLTFYYILQGEGCA